MGVDFLTRLFTPYFIFTSTRGRGRSSLLLTTINVLTPHNHGFLCGVLRGNVTSPKTFEAFNVAYPFLGTSLRGGFLYGLTLIFLGFWRCSPQNSLGLGLPWIRVKAIRFWRRLSFNCSSTLIQSWTGSSRSLYGRSSTLSLTSILSPVRNLAMLVLSS